MKKLAPLLLTSLFSLPLVAQEEESPALSQERQPEKLNFEQLDRNLDGFIDLDEAKADKELAKIFITIAKEGKLEQQEYVEWRAGEAKKVH